MCKTCDFSASPLLPLCESCESWYCFGCFAEYHFAGGYCETCVEKIQQVLLLYLPKVLVHCVDLDMQREYIEDESLDYCSDVSIDDPYCDGTWEPTSND